MAKVKIQGSASGTGIFTVTAPDSDTNRTITLPDGTGTLAFTTGDDDKLPLAGGTMTGAITTNSTFDGRDVSVDGAKLDLIEANADVTDTTNVTSAGALMDSEVTNLAAVKAFDTSDYATAAQGTTADAALPKAGGAMTGAITTNSTFDGRDVATDGTKLDGIASSANNYTHPTSAGNVHIPSGGAAGQILRYASAGTAAWGADENDAVAMAIALG